MKKSIALLCILLGAAFLLCACKKKEPTPSELSGGAHQSSQSAPSVPVLPQEGEGGGNEESGEGGGNGGNQESELPVTVTALYEVIADEKQVVPLGSEIALSLSGQEQRTFELFSVESAPYEILLSGEGVSSLAVSCNGQIQPAAPRISISATKNTPVRICFSSLGESLSCRAVIAKAEAEIKNQTTDASYGVGQTITLHFADVIAYHVLAVTSYAGGDYQIQVTGDGPHAMRAEVMGASQNADGYCFSLQKNGSISVKIYYDYLYDGDPYDVEITVLRKTA